ncbi:hypothetical protein PIB30_071809 [Stylosanthes scabra]|uniref:Uncharacterized protein n=1 Tax=Stylosanthes scabra TaxID=79078 RepID=A0ABU6RP16_9FABA|nr:hypothetical protein [Stylosanthes scabra]
MAEGPPAATVSRNVSLCPTWKQRPHSAYYSRWSAIAINRVVSFAGPSRPTLTFKFCQKRVKGLRIDSLTDRIYSIKLIDSKDEQIDLREAFYSLFKSESDMIAIPSAFYKPFNTELGSAMVFRDYFGNSFEVNHKKDFHVGHFGVGFKEMVHYYGILQGGWLKGFYVGQGGIYIRVIDSFAREIVYPRAPKSFSLRGNNEVYIMSYFMPAQDDWVFVRSQTILQDSSVALNAAMGSSGGRGVSISEVGDSLHSQVPSGFVLGHMEQIHDVAGLVDAGEAIANSSANGVGNDVATNGLGAGQVELNVPKDFDFMVAELSDSEDDEATNEAARGGDKGYQVNADPDVPVEIVEIDAAGVGNEEHQLNVDPNVHVEVVAEPDVIAPHVFTYDRVLTK